MYLKSLELHGFKSFPDKTVLKFNNGTTVIVGPNGSGKSNMTDAMRWVLGELSSKNIRGSKMEDVIFSGADGKKPMSFAEVSVTFDDSVEPKVLNTSYDEITVTRRYYRNGESEYFINKKKVRLKDIYEMFMNTGIGREGYSIIGQGRIAEIISKKSEDRRGVFEESAGISKFRYRKNESEKKLAETEINMSRVADIEKELEARLGPLERDSEKARRYLEYYGDKKKVDISLWLYDVNRLKGNIDKAALDANMSAHELEIADDNIRQTDERIDRLYQQSHTGREESQRNHETLAKTVQLKGEAEANLLVYQNKIENTESRIQSEQMVTETIRADVEKESAAAETARRNAAGIEKKYTEAAERQDALTADCIALTQQVNVFAERILADDKKRKALEDERTDFRIRQNVLSESLKSADERKEGIAADLLKYETEAEALALAGKESEGRSDGLKAAIRQVDAQLEAVHVDTYEAETAKVQTKLSLKKAEIDSLNSRVTALRNMQEHFEGYYNSVRYVMQEKERIGGIHGPVSYLIKVDPKYVVAVETALGAALQNIVTDDEESAKRAIRQLKNANAGRATFYPLTTIRYHGRGREYDGVNRFRGFVGYADELVHYDGIYTEVIRSLLAKTAVFDTLDNASDMARANNWRIRAVTLDGQQINQGGSFTGGQAKKDSGVLTRNNQIDALMADGKRLTAEKAALEKELEQAITETGRALNTIEELKGKRDALSAELVSEAQVLHDAMTRRGILCELADNLRRDTSDLEKAYAESKAQCDVMERQIAAHTEDILALQQASAKQNEEKTALAENAERLQIKLNEVKIRCAELARDREAAENSLSEVTLRLEARTKELSEHEAAALAFGEEVSALKKSIAETERAVEEYTRTIDELNQKQQSLSEAVDRIDTELSQLRNRQKEQNSKKELIFIAHSKNESKLNELKAQHEKVSDQLWSDYELTYSSAERFAEENNCETVTEKTRMVFAARQNELKSSLKSLGNVNLDSIEEYNQVKQRHGYMKGQLDDLRDSKKELTKILEEIESDMKRMFTEAFEKINRYFGEVFRELFGGGHAEVVLTDPENVLTSGIEINAAPPGKSVKNLNLLSGGEQSFIAIALLFALIKVNPSPFCIFDEVEAALDEVNVTRVGRYVKKYSNEMQFVMITHRRGTMEIADTLYGVTMPQNGVSKVYTLDPADSTKNNHINELKK